MLDGGASVRVGEELVKLAAGDTLVLPAHTPRCIAADPGAGLVAIVAAPASMRAYVLDGAVVGAHCAVPDHDKLVPAWVA